MRGRKILVGLGGILGFVAVRRFSFQKSHRFGFTLDRKKLLPPVFMEFVRIPGKEWQMGKYVVTQEQWKEVMGAEPWKGEKFVKEGDRYSATYISWNDCREFVKKLNDSPHLFSKKVDDG